MKSIQASSILKALAILLVATITIVTKNNGTEISQTNKAPTTQTDDNEPTFFNSMFGTGTERHSANEVPASRVAMVDIVYPRFPGESPNPCTIETNSQGKKITHIIIEKGTQLCNMSEAQINSVAQTTSYEKEKLCKCITEFCGEDLQSEEFVECLNKPESL